MIDGRRIRAADELCRTSSLLDGREQPIAATRAHEGPQFSDLARLAAFDSASARAFDHAVYCFAAPGHAEKFRQRFGGEKFDPKTKGKGGNWARWEK
jgi:hypothetical protein